MQLLLLRRLLCCPMLAAGPTFGNGNGVGCSGDMRGSLASEVDFPFAYALRGRLPPRSHRCGHHVRRSTRRRRWLRCGWQRTMRLQPLVAGGHSRWWLVAGGW
eukprot:362595-Chlamydomonas_euryale.AAC.1